MPDEKGKSPLPKLGAIKPDKLIKVLELAGYRVARTRGSHVIMTKEGTGRTLVVTRHPRKDIPPEHIKNQLRSAGITLEKYFELLARA